MLLDTLAGGAHEVLIALATCLDRQHYLWKLDSEAMSVAVDLVVDVAYSVGFKDIVVSYSNQRNLAKMSYVTVCVE